MTTTCVIFDVANSIMPNRLAVFMERLRLEHPEGYEDMEAIRKAYFFGARDKAYLAESLKIKLGLSDKELKDLELDSATVEKFFGPVIGLLQKAGVATGLIGNLGGEDSAVYHEFGSAKGSVVRLFSSEIGQVFGEPDAAMSLAKAVNGNPGVVVVSSDQLLLDQLGKLGIAGLKYTNYREMGQKLFAAGGAQ